MRYEWNSMLETGHAQIDGQHKQLISSLNELVDAHEQGRGRQELQRMLEFLTAYTVKHFEDEEALQRQYDYPDYMEHKVYHNEFKNTVKQLTDRLKKEDYNNTLVEEVIQTVAAWLTHHIKGDDFKMAAYIMRAKNGEK